MVDSRRTLGQWYTPPAVVELALSLADVRPACARRVLDPTCGDGAFLARARERVADSALLAGIDIDPEAARAASGRVPGAGITCADLFSLPAQAIEPADAVVGNPPYVRKERLSAAAKARIRERLAADFPDAPGELVDRLAGRGDLAVACAARCLRLARPGGRVALVVSSALVDADYAKPLWELLRSVGRLDVILDAPAERWFPDAAINAVIVAIEMHGARSARRGAAPALIAKLREPTELASTRIRERRDLGRGASLREVSADEPETWTAALRGSDVWLDFERRAGAALVPLGEIATLRRGVTSGANDVFYLSRERAAELAIEPELLVPLLRAPPKRTPARIEVDPTATSHVALVAPPEAEELARFPAAARYFEARAEAARRPTLRGRHPWWALSAAPARLFLTKAYAARFVQQLSPGPAIADQRVYSVHPERGVDLELLAAVLNSTFTALALESLGRASMGEGALEWTVSGAKTLPVLDPRRLSSRAARGLREAFRALAPRPIGDVAAERHCADRRALDRAAASACPEAAARIEDVHAALIGAAKRRAARAESLKALPA